jgi:dTDP-4-amino-4,6-dideoxygalactose transaminase
VYHLYVIRVSAPPAGPGREAVWSTLRQQGVEAQVHYPVPLHLQPALSYLGHATGTFPEAERAADEVLSIPLFPLMTEEQQDRVAAALNEALRA